MKESKLRVEVEEWRRLLVVMAGALALMLGCSDSSTSQTLSLVKDGKTDYVIVVDKNVSQPDRFAAEELKRHLEKSTGAVFPIVTEMPSNGKAIVFKTR